MYIELPETFTKTDDEGNFVKVRKGMLLIRGEWNFEKIMIEIAYQMKGRHKCLYCKERLYPKKVTIDHIYPVAFGGVTITNNLKPACKACNSKKSNMNAEEFSIWLTKTNNEERKKYYHHVISQKEKRIYDRRVKEGFDLPAEWIKYRDINSIVKKYNSNSREKTYRKTLEFFKMTGKLPRPIVLSRNNIVLIGKNAYDVARENRIKKVPVIFLSNVLILK